MSVITADKLELGTELPTLRRDWTLQMFIDRHDLVYGPGRIMEEEWPEKNIHADEDAAKREGLDGPVAGAPQIIAEISKIMMSSFGAGWVVGGRISVKMIRPVGVGDVTTARVKVTGLEYDGVDGEATGRIRVNCRVWVERADGTAVLVGTASALAE